jgi:hypothetical protein
LLDGFAHYPSEFADRDIEAFGLSYVKIGDSFAPKLLSHLSRKVRDLRKLRHESFTILDQP